MLTINKHVILTILATLVTTTLVKFIFAGTVVLNPVGIIVTLLFLFLLMQVYLKGHEGKGITEGIRFGLLMGLVVITYKLTGIDVITVDNSIIHTLVEYLVIGVTFSLVHKK